MWVIKATLKSYISGHLNKAVGAVSIKLDDFQLSICQGRGSGTETPARYVVPVGYRVALMLPLEITETFVIA